MHAFLLPTSVDDDDKEEKKIVDVKKKNHFMAYDRSNFITQKWKKEGFMYIKFYIFIE